MFVKVSIMFYFALNFIFENNNVCIDFTLMIWSIKNNPIDCDNQHFFWVLSLQQQNID